MTRTIEAAPGARRAPRARAGVASLVIAVLGMLGTGVALYPAGAGWFSQLEQSLRVDDYTQVMTELGPDGREAELASARAYNATLSGGALIDPYGGTPLADQQAIVRAYQEQLDLGPADVMARIRIPSIAVDLPIFHGTDEDTLRKGVGHLLGSALPVGGESSHTVLTAHRGLPEAVLFSDLDQVEAGAVFELEIYGEVLVYRVREVQVIEPGNTDLLLPESGRDLVSLVTCTPLGINSHRIIVTGERIPTPAPDTAAAQELVMPAVPGPPWWSVLLAGGWALSVAYRSLAVAQYARRRRH